MLIWGVMKRGYTTTTCPLFCVVCARGFMQGARGRCDAVSQRITQQISLPLAMTPKLTRARPPANVSADLLWCGGCVSLCVYDARFTNFILYLNYFKPRRQENDP